MRAPTIIGSDGKPRALSAGTRAEVFAADLVRDPARLALALTRLAGLLAEAVGGIRVAPFAAPVIFEAVAVAGGGVKVSLEHNLGRAARWWVCRWRDPAAATALAGASFVEDPSSSNRTLVLRSYTAGIADLVVA